MYTSTSVALTIDILLRDIAYDMSATVRISDLYYKNVARTTCKIPTAFGISHEIFTTEMRHSCETFVFSALVSSSFMPAHPLMVAGKAQNGK